MRLNINMRLLGSLNPNKPNGLSHSYTLGESICNLRGVRYIVVIFVPLVIEIPASKQ